MSLEDIVNVIAGDTGAIAILIVLVFLLVKGKIVSKEYVDDLKHTNASLTQAVLEQSEAIDNMTETAVEALENSRVTLRILTEARNATGVKGDELDE